VNSLLDVMAFLGAVTLTAWTSVEETVSSEPWYIAIRAFKWTCICALVYKVVV